MREIPWQDIPREKVMHALRRVLVSEEFKTSPQLAAFLSFSVSRTLDGRGALLKAYTVATEVLGRHADFDPQTDPIVRVEATRLRRALEHYYLGEGRDDPVRITMPRGGYAIVVHGRDEDPNERPPIEPETPRRRIIKTAKAAWSAGRDAIAILSLAGFGVTSILLFLGGRPAATETGSDTRPRYGAILAGTIAGLPSDDGFGLADTLVETAGHFDGISVFSGMVPRPPDDLYVVEGVALKEMTHYRIDLKLRHATTGRVVWTRHLQLKADSDHMRLAGRRLAHIVVGRDGPIRADAMPAKADGVSGRDAPRSCLAVTDAALRSTMTPLLNAARRCLDEAIAVRSESPILLTASATLRHHLAGGDLDVAEQEAKMAISLDPGNAEALNILAEHAIARGEATALELGEKLIAANPYDPALLRAEAKRRTAMGSTASAAQLLADATSLEASAEAD